MSYSNTIYPPEAIREHLHNCKSCGHRASEHDPNERHLCLFFADHELCKCEGYQECDNDDCSCRRFGIE